MRDFLGVAEQALGAGSMLYPIDDIALLTFNLSTAFEGGAVSLFAQQHLFNGACP